MTRSAAGRPTVVVGAGIGGLACAARLAARGVDVLVLEAAAAVGGKLRRVTIGDRALDAGPTVLTMRWVFDALFADAGARFADRLALTPAAILARHAWNDRERLDLYADAERSADAIGRFAGAAEAAGFRAFCERARSIYRTLEDPFLKGSRPNPVSLARRVTATHGLGGLGDLTRISPFATMWTELSRYFRDPRLLQLFGRYATYCGSSPFAAPATLMLVAHVEQEGVWLVDGGMHGIAAALATLVAERGGRVRCDAPVRRVVVERGRVAAVELDDGERIEAAAVVFNGDAAALADGLLGHATQPAVRPLARAERSLSALTWHLDALSDGFPLTRHNVFFGGDSRREFDDLFARRTLPEDPTVYVCAQDRDAAGHDDDASVATGTRERLMCLVNAPADADLGRPVRDDVARCTTRMFDRLAACGLRVDRTIAPVETTPLDFARLFPATGGGLYGRATHGWSASFARPAATTRVAGLYLAGGSVHPGPGVPMAALSGRLAADAVLADRNQ